MAEENPDFGTLMRGLEMGQKMPSGNSSSGTETRYVRRSVDL